MRSFERWSRSNNVVLARGREMPKYDEEIVLDNTPFNQHSSPSFSPVFINILADESSRKRAKDITFECPSEHDEAG